VSHNRPALENATTTASAVLGDHDTAAGGCGHLLLLPGVVQRQAAAVAGHTAFSDPRSELTCNNNNKYDATWSVVVPRKRARIGGAVDAAGLVMEGHRHRALLPVPQAFAPGGGGEGALGGGSSSSSRVLCSGAASTSGRPSTAAPVSQSQHGILAHLYRHSVEVDALVRIEVRCVPALASLFV
jgi:E3 ubiquitin-protein ligase BOI-like protein